MLLDKDIIQKPPNSRIIQQKLKFVAWKSLSFDYFRSGNNTSKTSISSDFIVTEFDLRLLAKLWLWDRKSISKERILDMKSTSIHHCKHLINIIWNKFSACLKHPNSLDFTILKPEVNRKPILDISKIIQRMMIGANKQVPCEWCGCEYEPFIWFLYMHGTKIMNHNFWLIINLLRRNQSWKKQNLK